MDINDQFDMQMFYKAKYGIVFKALRMVQDKTLEDIAQELNDHISHLHTIEKGTSKIKYETFNKLCSVYGIDTNKFMQIARTLDNNEISFQEVLLLCSKFESEKAPNHNPITEVEKKQKLSMILKSMRISQGKSLKSISDEVDIHLVRLSQYESGSINPKEKTLNKLIEFYKISNDDFEVLYKVALMQNLSYPQLLHYCLRLDIGRQKKESIQPKSPDNDEYIL